MLRRMLMFNSIYRQSIRAKSSNNPTGGVPKMVELNAYHEASDNTLEELSEKLESVLEDRFDKGADVSLNSGVLTVVVDTNNTYVINKQTPNRQIWLSSPLSGPKRFDLVSGCWIDKHSRTELKKLLSKELSQLLDDQVEC